MTETDCETIVTTSVVFGYVRLDVPDSRRLDLLRQRIAQ